MEPTDFKNVIVENIPPALSERNVECAIYSILISNSAQARGDLIGNFQQFKIEV